MVCKSTFNIKSTDGATTVCLSWKRCEISNRSIREIKKVEVKESEPQPIWLEFRVNSDLKGQKKGTSDSGRFKKCQVYKSLFFIMFA